MRAGFRLLRTQALRERKRARLAADSILQAVVRGLRGRINKKMRNA